MIPAAVTAVHEQPELDLGILLKSLRGLTLWRPMAILAISLFLGFAALLVLVRLGSSLGGLAALLFAFLGGIIDLAFAGAGYLGAGFSLAATVQERGIPGIGASLLFGLITLPRLVGLLAIELLILLGLLLVEVIVIEICRIPVLGGILSLAVFPALFLFNIALTAIAFVVFNLSGPALWFGETIRHALGHVIAVARSRPGPTIFVMLMLFLMYLLVAGALAVLTLYAGMLSQSLIVGAMGSAVLETLASLFSFSSLFQAPLAGFGGGVGAGFPTYLSYAFAHISVNDRLYVYSFLIAFAALGVVVVAIPNTVLQLGLAYLYNDSARLVDTEAGAAVMSGVMEKFSAAVEATRRSAATAAQQTRELLQRATACSRSSEQAPSVPAQDKNMFCTNCGAALSEEDRFCGECGHPR